jgi:progesterone-induced-blocking factor 1
LALAEGERLREELSALRSEHDRASRASAQQVAALENQAAELRSEVKMRSFELTALGLTHEAKMGELRSAELRVQELGEQVGAHTASFRRLEEMSSLELRRLEGLVEDQRRTLGVYEGLEVEMDAAVLRAASEGETGTALATLAADSTLGERRVRQSVHLARLLLEKERRLEAMAQELTRVRAEVVALQQSKAEAEHRLSITVDQPSRCTFVICGHSNACPH